jgi:hypothetical protein
MEKYLSEGGSFPAGASFEGSFRIVAASPGSGEIAATHGQTLKATYTTDDGITLNFMRYTCRPTVEMDTMGPTFSNVLPLDFEETGTSLSNPVTFQATVRDPVGVGNVIVTINGKSFNPNTTLFGDERIGFYPKQEVDLTLTLPLGAYTWSMTATDKLNNTSTSGPFTMDVIQ